MMSRELQFQNRLEISAGIKLDLKINDNISTMLSVKWGSGCAKVSLHRMFLEAPQNIMQALACYLKGEDSKLAPSIRAYIESQLPKLDYSHQLDVTKLETKGKVYNLQKIYNQLNREYFDGALNQLITWYGKIGRRPRTRLVFGQYQDTLKLIKINRILDSTDFPEYFVAYVIYHEMVHSICPSYVDEKGVNQIHSKEFKTKEKEFVHFEKAEKWMKDNNRELFEKNY